jgi:hypothetical protein
MRTENRACAFLHTEVYARRTSSFLAKDLMGVGHYRYREWKDSSD